MKGKAWGHPIMQLPIQNLPYILHLSKKLTNQVSLNSVQITILDFYKKLQGGGREGTCEPPHFFKYFKSWSYSLQIHHSS